MASIIERVQKVVSDAGTEHRLDETLVGDLRELLLALRMDHRHTDDSFLCCPKCDNPDHGMFHHLEGDETCDCGADNHNRLIDEALKS